MASFNQLVSSENSVLRRASVTTVQLNVGKVCNQSCSHCHVDAGPLRTESMSWATMQQVIDALPGLGVQCVDITGGAPELNPHFRQLIQTLSGSNYSVMVRCNLTIIQEPGMQDLPDFYRDNDVHIVASLPCYTEETTDGQRGKGVFNRSIDALRKLNQVGYGQSLPLDLVYNPSGAFLPPDQDDLECQYRHKLRKEFGIEFSRLVTITNVPVGRFARALKAAGQYESYVALLRAAFNGDTVPGLMCRHLINVGWDGTIYDCDFNAMEESPILHQGKPLTVWQLDKETSFATAIATADYCFACTAGCGSSCTGALTSKAKAAKQ